MPLTEMCDICGRDVDFRDAIRAEMTTDELMCPTSMTFHPACYEAAAAMWHVDGESMCTVDAEFREVGLWDDAAHPLPG